jgi:ATP-dependent helicase/nuclease subunit A
VPCIAVLRSPLVGLSLDELAEIRLAATDTHFWTALNRAQSPKSKVQSPLAAKVSTFLERFSRWRKLAKQVSLSQCLEAILAETLYADWLRAQPRGAQRGANVASFLHLTQQFDQFQRQGLFRFLKFIEAQQEAEAEPEIPAMATENTARLMSIHQSKGLEFPVVVLADLGKPFNEQDLRGDIIFDERFGLCPKVKPPHTGRRYPSLPHWLARRRQQRELRGEELRLLYVALTRARDNLILTASVTGKNWEEKWTQPQPVTAQKIAGAKCFADWLALWFSVQSPKSKVQSESEGDFEHLRWRIVTDAEWPNSTGGSRGDEAQAEIGNRKSAIENRPEPSHAGCSGDVEKLRARLEWNYPFRAATEQKAKSSVTALRREAEELDDEAEQFFAARNPAAARRKVESGKRKLSAAEIGAAHHKFLQRVALDQTGGLTAEAERLVRENYLSADERANLDLDALAAFWNSPLGKRVVAHAANARRELPFTARFSPGEIAEITGAKPETGLENEFVVVQGVADLVVLLPDEVWLVDFKTDEVGKNELPGKINTYRPQLQLYAAALEKIFSRAVTLRALHFLAVGRTVEL